MPEAARARQLEVLLAEDNEFDVQVTIAAFRDARVPSKLHCVPDGEAALAFLRHTGEYQDVPARSHPAGPQPAKDVRA